MSVGERAIYRFPSGQLLPEHAHAFGEALSRVLVQAEAPVCVVLALGSVPDAVPELGADGYDATHDCALLDYQNRARLLAGLWPLFLGAEPELFFTRSDGFERARERVGEYGEAILALRKARGAQSVWQRMRTPAPRFAIEETSLVRAYAPVVTHEADGTCRVIEAG